MNIFELLKIEEGFSSTPYLCSEGYPTIGIGTRIGPKGADIDLYELEVDFSIASKFLKRDIDGAEYIVDKTFDNLFGPRLVIVKSMVYQLGASGFLKFKNFIECVNDKDWNGAHDEMLNSKWARQCKNRANRHANVMKYSSWSAYEGL